MFGEVMMIERAEVLGDPRRVESTSRCRMHEILEEGLPGTH